MSKIKKAQRGVSAVSKVKPSERKVITEKEVYDEFRPSLRTYMTQSDRKPASDSLIKKRTEEGYMKIDPKSGDFIPGPNYNKPRRVPAQPSRVPLQKNGGKTKAMAKYGKSIKKKK